MRKYISFLIALFLCFQIGLATPSYGADQKISELTDLAAKPASDDKLVIYDSSTGSTKRVDYTYLEDIKNVNLYGGLTAAVASFGSTEVTLLITDAQTVTDNLSIPTTMQLFINRGGDLAVSSGKILTINGSILAGAYQIFSGSGTVAFSGNGIAYNNWWATGGSTYTAGDIFYLDADKKFSTLAKGTAGKILTMNSGATAPEWRNTINLTGGQIAFPATAVPSADPNTLDDYEEGTFTPDLQFGGAKVGITYGTQLGEYTKNGRIVCLTSYLGLTSKGTSVGAATLEAIPFTINSAAGAQPVVSVWADAITFANAFNCYGTTNSTSLVFGEITEAGVNTNLADTNFANGSQLSVSLTYFI